MNFKRVVVNISRKPIKIIGKFFGLLRRITIFDYFFSFMFMSIYQLPTSPTHYYSPLPDLNKLKRNNKRWLKEIKINGHDWNDNVQIENIKKLTNYKGESDQISDIDIVNKSGYGEGFPPVEAEILYYMIRDIKPSKVVEVGSGVSTYYSLKAIEMNKQKDNVDSQMICVEPYPREKFQSFADEGKILYYKQQAQDVDISVFKLLNEGDILFIDSSHVLKADSDVTYLYLDVLPSLNKGVIVHIHDICYPYNFLQPENKLHDSSILWNETQILTALLTNNDSFRILFSLSYLHYKQPEILKSVSTKYAERLLHPSSIWLEKTK